MEISFFLAKVLGVYFVIAGLLVLVRQKDLTNLIYKIKNSEIIFVFGVIATIVGILIIASHNLWSNTPEKVISIVGWIAFMKGLFILFFPLKLTTNLMDFINKPLIYNVFGIISLMLGLWLSYFGFVL